MKKQTPILLLTVLLLIFSGCSSKEYNIGGIKIPSFGEKRLDTSLPTVKGLKAVTSMSRVSLEWQPIRDKNIAGYRIFRGDSKNGYKLIKTLSDRYTAHYTDSNLDQNINYTYKVSTYTNDGRVSQTSTTHTARTRKKLSSPNLIQVSKGFPNRVKLIWGIHPNSEVKSYIIQRLEQGEKEWRNIKNINDRLSVEYIDKDVKPAQPYSYRLYAKSYDGVISPPSKTILGSSKKLPNAIKEVKATDNFPRMINVIWKATNKQKDILYYNVYSSSMKNTLFSLQASTKERKFTDKFDSDGIVRYYKITAVDHDGLESAHAVPAKMGKTVGASRGPILTKTTLKNNTIYLEWMDPDGKARKYTVVKKYWDGWRAKRVKITDFKKTKFTDTKIKPDTKYTYYIISIDKHGIESIPSEEVVFSINSNR